MVYMYQQRQNNTSTFQHLNAHSSTGEPKNSDGRGTQHIPSLAGKQTSRHFLLVVIYLGERALSQAILPILVGIRHPCHTTAWFLLVPIALVEKQCRWIGGIPSVSA